MDVAQVRFVFDGMRVNPANTPDDVGMDDGDTIDAFLVSYQSGEVLLSPLPLLLSPAVEPPPLLPPPPAVPPFPPTGAGGWLLISLYPTQLCVCGWDPSSHGSDWRLDQRQQPTCRTTSLPVLLEQVSGGSARPPTPPCIAVFSCSPGFF